MSIEGIYLNIIKTIYDKPTANVILNGEKLKAFPLRSGTKPEYSLSPFSFNIILEVLPMKIREAKKKKKRIQIGKEVNSHYLQTVWYSKTNCEKFLKS